MEEEKQRKKDVSNKKAITLIIIAVILLAAFLISSEFISPTKQANEVSQLNKLLAEKDEKINTQS